MHRVIYRILTLFRIVIGYEFLKITNLSNRDEVQIRFSFTKALPYISILTILKTAMLAFGPLFIATDLAVGFALVINLLKTLVYGIRINMEEANM